MVKVRVWVWAACLLLPAMQILGEAAHGQGLSGPKLAVGASTTAERLHPGDTFEIRVELRLPPETHVNAHVPSDPDLIPTEVRLAQAAGIRVQPFGYPEAVERTFSFTPKPIRVYEGRVVMRAQAAVAAGTAPGPLTLRGTVSAQPCTSTSCFAPTTLPFELPIEVVAAGTDAGRTALATPDRGATGPVAAHPAGSRASPAAGLRFRALTRFAPPEEFLAWLRGGDPAAGGSPEGRSGLGDLIRGGNWLLAIPLIFLAGLALNLTPCVYPLIPITIGFFGGQSGGSRRHLLGLASLYVLGMAAMYSTLGVLAATTRQLFGSQLQSPYVLVGFAAVMAALGLSMFGVWEFRLPAGLASRVTGRAGLAGALVMGLLVGFVAAPCIGPVVVALLQVVGSMGDPLLGFVVFFTLSLGLGVPYLVLGVFSGLIQRLPRSGEWMNAVKRVFGLVMFGMALYYLAPLLGEPASSAALGVYTAGAGLYLALLDTSGRGLRRFMAAKRGMGVAAIAVGAAMLMPRQEPAGIPFAPYTDQAVRDAAAQGLGVLIDFSARWCAACRELDARTFRDPKVVAATRDLVVLRMDMTRWDDPESSRLREAYRVVGLPTVVYIPPGGAAERR